MEVNELEERLAEPEREVPGSGATLKSVGQDVAPESRGCLLKPIEFTISDSQLHAVLSEIDAELRASGTKLFGRELRGWQMFCRRFKLQMAMHDPLAVRIFDWFTKQYGDRLRGNLDFGSTVAEIRHDLYSLRFPRLYGEQIVHCDLCLATIQAAPGKGRFASLF